MSSTTAVKPGFSQSVTLFDLGRRAVTWRQTAPLLAALDAVLIVATSTISGLFYAEAFYDGRSPVLEHAQLGLFVAALFLVVAVIRGGYDYVAYTGQNWFSGKVLASWNIAFGLLALMLFMMKAGSDASRGAVILFYLTGLGVLLAARHTLAGAVSSASRLGKLAARRLFIVGHEADLTAFAHRFQPWTGGFSVAGWASIGSDEDGIKQAVEFARAAKPDDILLVVPWAEEARLSQLVDAFKVVPAAIQIDAPVLFDRYERVTLSHAGRMRGVVVTPAPLTPFDRVAKRALDLVLAGMALIVLAPFFAAVAILIKWDSKGPVFFRQRRHGFNQGEFQIYKFRTMTVTEDGAKVIQAKRGDARVTGVGRFLRRTSIDELPQLLNVLLGQMSIVGPRPHAIAHNQEFVDRIALYARRHNVKPGITGWAQVHGLRGETDTEDKMRARVAHDLYYLDNWCLVLDIRIILMTVSALVKHRDVY